MYYPVEQSEQLDSDAYVRIARPVGNPRPGWSTLIFDSTRRVRSGSTTGISPIQFSEDGMFDIGGDIVGADDPGLGEEADLVYDAVHEIAIGFDGRRQKQFNSALEIIKGNYGAVMTGERGEVVRAAAAALVLAGSLYAPQVVSGDRDTYLPQPLEALNDFANRPDHRAQGIEGYSGAARVIHGEGLVDVPYVSVDDYNPENVPTAIYRPWTGPAHQDSRPGTYRVSLGFEWEEVSDYYFDAPDFDDRRILATGCVPVRGNFETARTNVVMSNQSLDGDLTIEAVLPGLAEICLQSDGDEGVIPLGEEHGTVLITQTPLSDE